MFSEVYFWSMNSFKQLVVLIVAVLYLFLSTGVVLFRTHCECSGRTSVSLYAGSQSTCGVSTEDSCCSDHTTSETGTPDSEPGCCSCDSPVVSYLKLTDHSGEDYRLEYPQGKPVFLIPVSVYEPISDFSYSENTKVFSLYSPPPNTQYGRFLLNCINQRKLALLS